MSKMKTLVAEIEEMLETTHLLCQQIADHLDCPVTLVEQVVQQRWEQRMSTASIWAKRMEVSL